MITNFYTDIPALLKSCSFPHFQFGENHNNLIINIGLKEILLFLDFIM